jgi:hypothetical protein
MRRALAAIEFACFVGALANVPEMQDDMTFLSSLMKMHRRRQFLISYATDPIEHTAGI